MQLRAGPPILQPWYDLTKLATKASLLGDRESVQVAPAKGEAIPAVRVATQGEHDLALLRVDGLTAPGEDGESRPAAGSWALVPDGAGGALAVGVVSGGPRPIPAGETSILPGALQRIVQLGMIRAFRSAPEGSEMRQLAEQLEQQERARRLFDEGSEPRTYPRVLQYDAPVDALRAGGPVLDSAGRLLGVNVGRAHHGTTYAVPIATVREAFARFLRQ